MLGVPLPTWSNLIGSLLSKDAPSEQVVVKNWCRPGDQAMCFSRSSWCFQAIALWWERCFNREMPRIWFPDYFCNQALEPLRRTSAKLTFYPIDENFDPKWSACQRLAEEKLPDIFVLVHYFGKASDSKNAKNFCKQTGAIFIEDAVHVILPVDDVGIRGDFVLYSPHKLLAIPDGAICVMRKSLDKYYKNKVGNIFSDMKDIKNEMGSTHPNPFFWVSKRVIQKLFLKVLSLKRSAQSKEALFSLKKEAKVLEQAPKMSPLAKKLLIRIRDYNKISELRNANLNFWNKYLKISSIALQPVFSENEVKVPYCGVFRALDSAQAYQAYTKLIEKGCLIQSWPDLPPEILNNRVKHQSAIKMKQSILIFRVHQSLSFRHLIKKIIVNDFDKYSISEISKFDWDNYFLLVNKPHLMQSWIYGEAKVISEKWIVTRFIICKDLLPVALLQVLKIKFLFFKVVRINRGPLWIGDEGSLDSIIATFIKINKCWPWYKANILLVNPNLISVPEHHAILSVCGFRSYSSGFISALVDLRKSEKCLEESFSRNWRRAIKLCRNEGVKTILSYEREDLSWLIGKYKVLKEKNKFNGISEDLLYALYDANLGNQNFMIFKAMHKCEIISSVLIVRYGLGSIPLVCWNEDRLGVLDAYCFLLLEATLELKKRGCIWFDVGGMSDKRNHERVENIGKFKRGMNGEEYTLVGDCILL